MTTWDVEEDGGGDYTTLASALSNGSTINGDIIDIRLEWDNDDTATAVIEDDLTIQTSGAARHAGFWDEASKHYRLVTTSTTAHALELVGTKTATIDGLAIEQAGTGTSRECFRCVPNAAESVLLKNCIFQCSTSTSQQDCLYLGFNTSIGDITFENCILYGAGRGGINSENGNQAEAATIHLNSCTIWNCGRAETAGGINVLNSTVSATIVLNIHNTVCVGNDTGSSLDFRGHGSQAADITWNISHSIDSDNSIATVQDTGTGTLASRTATDDTTPGAGDFVVFRDITSAPYDLRLAYSAENDAQNMHSTATAHGLTIPATDITGRPRSVLYECGAFSLNVITRIFAYQAINRASTF